MKPNSSIVFKIGLPNTWIIHLLSRERARIAQTFLSLMKPDKISNSCLEIGGPNLIATDILAPRFSRYFIVNPIEHELKNLSSSDTIVPIRGDGCRLPFANKSVDFIFSNAVIEHIPKTERYLLAQEIQRVCKKGFFISTPNYWFPVEPHYQIPFFQYIPETVKRFLLRWTSIGSVSRHSNIYAKLLTPKELKKLFPRAVIEEIRILLLPEIIYAYSVEDDKKDLG